MRDLILFPFNMIIQTVMSQMTEKIIPDSEIISRINSGNSASFGILVDRYGSKLYNLAYKILRNEHDAEDAVQDAFINIFQNLSKYRGDSSFYTWAYKITVNAALGRIRGQKTEEVSIDKPDPDHLTGLDIPDWSRNPLAEALRGEEKELLSKAIAALPDLYRTIFVLRDIEEISIKETMEILDLTEENVKIRLRRARIFLREKLANYFLEKGH